MQEATQGFRHARWLVLALALVLVGGLLSTAAATAGPAAAQSQTDDDDDDDGLDDDDDGVADNDDEDDGGPAPAPVPGATPAPGATPPPPGDDDDDGMDDDDDGIADNDDNDDDDDDGGPGPSPVPGRTAGRLEGADRFITSVAISMFEFPNGSDVVFLARADQFADAVSGGSLTRGPILLVPACGDLPAPVAAEIGRLAPTQVIALGGVSAVCEDIVDQALAA